MSKKCQEDIFLNKEGDKWFERNFIDSEAGLGERIANDKTITCFEYLDIIPKNVLEIGCSSGWRLKGLRKKYK